MVSFGYHNIILKRIRIWIITLKLKNFNCIKVNYENIMHKKIVRRIWQFRKRIISIKNIKN